MIENDMGTPGENGLGTTGKRDLTIFEDTGDLKAEDMAGVSTADLRWKQSNGLFGKASLSLSGAHYVSRVGIGDRRRRVRLADVLHHGLVRGTEKEFMLFGSQAKSR
ncbi:MAG: hypothetical protein CVU64_07175 [Deltaproteobacteria bacterium HGW-Deltaproteobacteria-21]|nr:MAG: hypothetical protein CVU64_07175 [Deltaproteobacteria bacterium HGW-Deltaproteobacteria-21]